MSSIDLRNKTVLLTGVAGFIGANLAKRLFADVEGVKIIGVDNVNDYYDVRLKEARLEELSAQPNFIFIKGSIADKNLIDQAFAEHHLMLLSTWQHRQVCVIPSQTRMRILLQISSASITFWKLAVIPMMMEQRV